MNERVLIVLFSCLLFVPVEARSEQGPSKQDVRAALRKAAEFFVTRVANQGGCHATYSSDLSYGRSGKGGRGPTQISATGGTTPLVGLAFLEVWEASGERWYLEAARSAARAMVKGQMCSGGWDYTTELDPAKRKKYRYCSDGDCCEGASDTRRNMTNLDNNTAQAVLRMLMRADRALNFEDREIHEAVLYALDGLMRAQYPNGAWPQRYEKFPDPDLFPVKAANYAESWSRTWAGPIFYPHYTFNDDVIVNMIDVMLEAARIYKEPRYQASAEKAGDFIILAQMPDPQPAWAQQYDAEMHPAWARSVEPPAVTGRESVSIMRGLILLYSETGKKKYLAPIPRAVDYLKRSSWLRDGKPVIARFYELKTNRPLYMTKGTRIYGPRSAGHTSKKTGLPFDGYEVTYSDKHVVNHYSLVTSAEPLDNILAEYERVLAADPATLRRPDKLKGLTPGTSRPRPPRSKAQLAERVQEVISSLDERGAWVQPGSIGGPGLLVSVNAAKDLRVVMAGNVFTLGEDETLEVYKDTSAPSDGVIHSGTFAANLRLLADYLKARLAETPL
ncbi:MAG TPA: pectate lyase [Sedimentisphaerales bacterium]|nr:pectate lyase [Sedimentisphaerales bacterium]